MSAPKTIRTLGCAFALLVVSTAVTACGTSDSASSSSGSFTKAAMNAAKIDPAIPASGCGSVPVPAAKDPAGVLKSLPQNLQRKIFFCTFSR